MIKYFLMPHPPIIVKEVGNGNEVKATKTIEACKVIGEKINNSKIDTIIIITPHGIVFRDAIAIITEQNIQGNLSNFGAGSVKFRFDIDRDLTFKIIKEAGENEIPVVNIDKHTSNLYGVSCELDHGAMVPLYFINSRKTYKLIHITYGLLSKYQLCKMGNCIKKAIEELGRDVAVIASGDLSHRLSNEGPYSFSEFGEKFDNNLINTLKNGLVKSIFDFDENTVKEAGECGLRSLYILAGIINSCNIASDIISYEAPFGVGYSVAEFKKKDDDLMKVLIREREEKHLERISSIKNPYTTLARKNLDRYFRSGNLVEIEEINNETLINDKKGVFVSLKINGELRGCIGTIFPTTNTVGEEIINNSISAALNDPRFAPVKYDELLEIDISVDLLGKPEKCEFSDLEPKTYGVIVTAGSKKGLLLPNLEGINDASMQVNIAKEKAGINEGEAFSIERFEVIRFSEVDDD